MENTYSDIHIHARADYARGVIETAARTGTAQVVVLDGGLCPAPLDRIGDLRFFEVDRPAVVTAKRLRLAKMGEKLPKSTVFVPLNKGQTLGDALCRHGFDKRRKTVFLWLGGSYSAAEAEIRGLFSELRSLAADGSSLIFDYVEAVYPNHPRNERCLFALSGGKAVTTDLTYAEIEGLLEREGLLVYERLSPEEITERLDPHETAQPISFLQAVLKK